MIRPLYCSGACRGSIQTQVEDRVRRLNEAPIREGAEYVLYWSQMNRRVAYNQALAYAIGQANALGLPLLALYLGLVVLMVRKVR